MLARDLRCIDAHVHLGNLVFHRSAAEAVVHYEVAVRFVEQALGADFDGFLVWGFIYNRPALRALHAYGLCLWRLGRVVEAKAAFLRVVAMNPNDNQGVRFLLADLEAGRDWEAIRSDDLAVLH